MGIIIDEQRCVGCGLCEELLPEVFIMQNQKARVKPQTPSETDNNAVKAVIDDCPAEAISFSEIADV